MLTEDYQFVGNLAISQHINKSGSKLMVQLSRRMLLGGAAASMVGGFRPSNASGEDSARPALPIPPELRASADGTIALEARPGSMRFEGTRDTPTYGVNGPYLGPAVRARRGEKVVMQVTNSLPEDTTMHWHGLIIPGAADGGPHQVISPGKQWRTELHIDQPAATLWFHPHYYPSTARQVLKGLAGLLIVDDDNEASALPLPSRWGVDDIPLIIEDRRFMPDGQLFDRMNIVAVTNGYIGDFMLVNGAHYPEVRAARGWLRFRILNGSNARSYILAASDGRSLYVIASDCGLLESPVELKKLLVHVGERFEVLVDGRNGDAFDVVTLPVSQEIMRLPPFDRPLTEGRSRSTESTSGPPAISPSAGELRNAAIVCCIRSTFTVASIGSSRRMANLPRPTGRAGKIPPRCRRGASLRSWCASRIRQTRTILTWRTVTFWSTRIPA